MFHLENLVQPQCTRSSAVGRVLWGCLGPDVARLAWYSPIGDHTGTGNSHSARCLLPKFHVGTAGIWLENLRVSFASPVTSFSRHIQLLTSSPLWACKSHRRTKLAQNLAVCATLSTLFNYKCVCACLR